MLATLTHADNKVEDLNIQRVGDGRADIDSFPAGRSPTARVSTLKYLVVRLIHGLPRLASSPGSIWHTFWLYYSAFLADFAWRNTKAEYFVDGSKETFSDDAAETTGSIISNTMDIAAGDASESGEERTSETAMSESECDDTKEKTKTNVTSDREFTKSMPQYAKYSLQLVVAALTSYIGVSICTYAVKYLHAQRARYLSQLYDVHRDQRRRTEPTSHDDPRWRNLVDRFVCYDDQTAAWRDIARRTSQPARLLDEGHNGDERLDGLNCLTTNTDHDGRENDKADDKVEQTNEDSSNRNREKDETNCKDAKEATEASDTDRVKDVGTCETTGDKKE